MAESLLVGSVAGEDSEQVFRTAGRVVGDSARRLPDGETGERSNWIGFQIGRLAAAYGIEFGEPRQNPSYEAFPQVRLTRPAEQIELGELGYAAAARSSYETFRWLKREGSARPSRTTSWRFSGTSPPRSRFSRALFSARTPRARRSTRSSRGSWRISEPIPPGVALGFHLCWGDCKHEHFVQPKSLELAVDVANRLASEVEHPIAWVHMPVPLDRKDDEYFRALRDLRLADGTELYLGVVHHDGLDGTQARIDACRRGARRRARVRRCQ